MNSSLGTALSVDLGSELDAFRAEIRAWIENNAPAGLADIVDWYDGATILAGSNRDVQAEARRSAHYLAWDELLLENRLIYPHWPEFAGGKGWSEVKTAIFAEECRRAGLPRVKRGFSADLVGTAVLLFGTEEQQKHFLPRIITGEDRYCQGFSEPNHGSDLGAVETIGVIDGDEIVITGQKVWTSAFQEKNMIFVLCRTDAAAPRGKALTFALVPFTAENNVEVRGIKQMSGAVEFSEDFFDGSRAPVLNIIGEVGQGWEVAMATLATERTADLLVWHLGYASEFEALLEYARDTGAFSDPLLRQRLSRAYIDIQIMRSQGARALALAARGEEPGDLAYIAKVQWSEYATRLSDLALDIGGARSVLRPDADEAHAVERDYAVDRWQDLHLASRGATIFSGANEIQRNIIAEQVLGLPREARGKVAPKVEMAGGVR